MKKILFALFLLFLTDSLSLNLTRITQMRKCVRINNRRRQRQHFEALNREMEKQEEIYSNLEKSKAWPWALIIVSYGTFFMAGMMSADEFTDER